MSVREFTRSVKAGGFGENDKKRFPAWLRRYTEFVNLDEAAQLSLIRDFAVEFSKSLRDGQIPASQRRQAVRTSIAKNAAPHSLRHSFATHLLESGASADFAEML